MGLFARKGANKETQIDLVGGLGNQLFGFIAGKYLEQVLGHSVVFNTWHIPRGLTNHGVTVEGRNLDGTFRSIPPAPVWKKPFQRKFGSKDLGWNPHLASVEKGTRVEGYFQTWRYFQALDPGLKSRDNLIVSAGPSSWLQENIELANSVKPFILHFRRGDYKKVPEVMGLLGREYYLKAITEIQERFGNSEIWLFSDEPDLAEDFFKDFDIKFRIISPPPDTDPGESLVLMTYGHGHIISNSTFAWWGAFLSPTSQIVIAPKPWFPQLKAPQDFFPENWVLLDHSWGLSNTSASSN